MVLASIETHAKVFIMRLFLGEVTSDFVENSVLIMFLI